MPISVSYEEQNGSCSASFVQGGASGTRVFTVDWADAFTFKSELLGGWANFPIGVYVQPNRFPYADYLYCNDVRIEGLGVPGEANNDQGLYITYAKAKVTASYGPIQNINPDDPEIVEEESITVSAEMMTMSDGFFKYVGGDPLPDSASPGKIETTTGFSITRYHVSSLPDATISGITGTVNNGTWRGYSAGYVLFAGADARRSITAQGAEDWEITYNFLIKDEHTWNQVLQKTTGNYVAVETAVGANPIYTSSNFSNLGV